MVEWRDGTSTWVDLKEAKETNPTELAEYAVANQINEEPAFVWWVPYALKKRERIVNKVKSNYWRTFHKYGIKLPKTPEEALATDQETDTDYLEKAMNKEMAKDVLVGGCTPQDVRTGKANELKGYQEISCHVIFDVKMVFTRKTRFVANGSTTDTPVGLCYSSVVSRDSVMIAFLVAALNDLDVFACGIGNPYLNAPCRENIWFVAGKECGERMKWKVMKVPEPPRERCSRTTLSPQRILSPRLTETYITEKCENNKAPYYEFLLVYVDDVLVVSHDPSKINQMIGAHFEIRNDVYGPLKTYLGGDVETFQLPHGKMAWSLLSTSYVRSVMDTVRRLLAEEGRDLKTGKKPHRGPLPYGYKSELDTTNECDTGHMVQYQQLIGILRWAVELGRIDIHIHVEVAIVSQY
ncbi:hypothetical protein ACHAWF_014513 [Thalassiosira exigua]